MWAEGSVAWLAVLVYIKSCWMCLFDQIKIALHFFRFVISVDLFLTSAPELNAKLREPWPSKCRYSIFTRGGYEHLMANKYIYLAKSPFQAT